MHLGTILKRGATTIEVVAIRADKTAVRIKYHDFPDMEIKDWYNVGLLLRGWEVV